MAYSLWLGLSSGNIANQLTALQSTLTELFDRQLKMWEEITNARLLQETMRDTDIWRPTIHKSVLEGKSSLSYVISCRSAPTLYCLVINLTMIFNARNVTKKWESETNGYGHLAIKYIYCDQKADNTVTWHKMILNVLCYWFFYAHYTRLQMSKTCMQRSSFWSFLDRLSFIQWARICIELTTCCYQTLNFLQLLNTQICNLKHFPDQLGFTHGANVGSKLSSGQPFIERLLNDKWHGRKIPPQII